MRKSFGFEALTAVWKARTYQIAETFVTYFYPSALASQALVDATKAWLDANPGIPALRNRSRLRPLLVKTPVFRLFDFQQSRQFPEIVHPANIQEVYSKIFGTIK